jgi:hypothetical protein
MPKVRRHVRAPMSRTTPKRYPRGSVLDQLDSEGHSDLVDLYKGMMKLGPIDRFDDRYDRTYVGRRQTGGIERGEGGGLK